MDFTLQSYESLINCFLNKDYNFQTFKDYLIKPASNAIILRHDVDKLPQNSLKFAQIQKEFGIQGSYYFRIVPQSFNPKIIEQMAELGHEIGYHYETFDEAVKSLKTKGQRTKIKEENLAEIAIELFEKHLEELRKYYPVKTICMHGSPLSKYDNKLLWKYYNYKDYGIIGEPYFDIDFNEVFYLTDTGRRWDGHRVSVRDKVTKERKSENGERAKKAKKEARERGDVPIKLRFSSTMEIIESIKAGSFPNSVMFTFHPQRWTDDPILWTKELVWQNVKNVGKRFLVKIMN